MLDVEEVFGKVLLLGARLWLAGFLRRVGPTPLVCLPISRAQSVEATELIPSGEPAPGTDSTSGPSHLLLRRGWFPLQCFLPTSCIRSEELSRGEGGRSLSHAWHWDATHPSCRSGEAEGLRRGARSSASLGPVFSLDPCGSYFSATELPAYPLASPSSCCCPVMVKGLKGELSVI